jgi:predicted DNA-binding protein
MDSKKTVGGESIRLRLTPELKKWLFDKSEKDGITVSEIMRNLIRAEMEK